MFIDETRCNFVVDVDVCNYKVPFENTNKQCVMLEQNARRSGSNLGSEHTIIRSHIDSHCHSNNTPCNSGCIECHSIIHNGHKSGQSAITNDNNGYESVHNGSHIGSESFNFRHRENSQCGNDNHVKSQFSNGIHIRCDSPSSKRNLGYQNSICNKYSINSSHIGYESARDPGAMHTQSSSTFCEECNKEKLMKGLSNFCVSQTRLSHNNWDSDHSKPHHLHPSRHRGHVAADNERMHGKHVTVERDCSHVISDANCDHVTSDRHCGHVTSQSHAHKGQFTHMSLDYIKNIHSDNDGFCSGICHKNLCSQSKQYHEYLIGGRTCSGEHSMPRVNDFSSLKSVSCPGDIGRGYWKFIHKSHIHKQVRSFPYLGQVMTVATPSDNATNYSEDMKSRQDSVSSYETCTEHSNNDANNESCDEILLSEGLVTEENTCKCVSNTSPAAHGSNSCASSTLGTCDVIKYI